eukprot:1143114-Alexandrium_andersonii.AAC.1
MLGPHGGTATFGRASGLGDHVLTAGVRPVGVLARKVHSGGPEDADLLDTSARGFDDLRDALEKDLVVPEPVVLDGVEPCQKP